MRFIHTSDWHLGRRLQTIDLIGYQSTFLDWLLATAKARAVDAVVVSGDVYDRSLPPSEAVDLLDRTVAAFADAGIPMVIIPGNHDHPVRLRYGGALFAQSGIHVRAEVAKVADPVVLADADGQVGFYGIPYLIPDAVMTELGAERSHESVLAAAANRIRLDAAARGLGPATPNDRSASVVSVTPPRACLTGLPIWRWDICTDLRWSPAHTPRRSWPTAAHRSHSPSRNATIRSPSYWSSSTGPAQ